MVWVWYLVQQLKISIDDNYALNLSHLLYAFNQKQLTMSRYSTWEQATLRKSLGHCTSCIHCLHPNDASLWATALGLRPKPFSIRQKIEIAFLLGWAAKNLLVIIQEVRCQGEEDCNPETTGLTCVKGSCVCPFYQVDTSIVNFHPLSVFSFPTSYVHIVNLILILGRIFCHPRLLHHIR